MKIRNLLLLSLLAAAASASAKSVVVPVGIDSLSFGRQGDYLMLDMDLNLKPTDVPSSRAQVMTPLVVTADNDTIALPSVGVYGKQRYINFLRNDRAALSKNEETSYKADERPMTMDYQASLPYAPNLNGCKLLMRRSLFGCANCLLDDKTDLIDSYKEPEQPERLLKYVEATNTGPITGTLDGAAYIDFVVDKTDINPTYRRNPQELLKIQHSIDTVLNDKGVTITGVWLKGFASPESPYEHNTELAIGRTEALKSHLNQLYKFDRDFIKTDYEPEDWEGLRNFVVKSNIDHKDEILALIDSDMAPDPKEALIKKRFPKEYKFMLEAFYPALRHTEYKITYEVKHTDDINKIRELMRTNPSRLTQREFYLLGNAVEPGSDEFNEVYETAVRMYPNDTVANINAANAALQRGDLVSAEKYLAKAGGSREAVFARATLAFAREDFAAAESLLDGIKDMEEAQILLGQIHATEAVRQRKTRSIMLE